MSSWGYNGYNEVWLHDSNYWIYRHLSQMAKTMIELASFETNDDLIYRALNQAVRELLLAQSSDWAFIMNAGTMTEYAVKRTCEHIHQFWQLEKQIRSGSVDLDYLSALEAKNNIFPDLDYRIYRQGAAAKSLAHII